MGGGGRPDWARLRRIKGMVLSGGHGARGVIVRDIRAEAENLIIVAWQLAAHRANLSASVLHLANGLSWRRWR